MTEEFRSILQDYGLPTAFAVVLLFFCAWLVNKIVSHFLTKDNEKDKQILNLSQRFTEAVERRDQKFTESVERQGNKFTEAVEKHTIAIDQLSKASMAHANSSEKILEHYAKVSDQHSDEHREIMAVFRTNPHGGMN